LSNISQSAEVAEVAQRDLQGWTTRDSNPSFREVLGV
jgi:hypothetical protein